MEESVSALHIDPQIPRTSLQTMHNDAFILKSASVFVRLLETSVHFPIERCICLDILKLC